MSWSPGESVSSSGPSGILGVMAHHTVRWPEGTTPRHSHMNGQHLLKGFHKLWLALAGQRLTKTPHGTDELISLSFKPSTCPAPLIWPYPPESLICASPYGCSALAF